VSYIKVDADRLWGCRTIDQGRRVPGRRNAVEPDKPPLCAGGRPRVHVGRRRGGLGKALRGRPQPRLRAGFRVGAPRWSGSCIGLVEAIGPAAARAVASALDRRAKILTRHSGLSNVIAGPMANAPRRF
jgi:hypothetical protein